MVEVQRADRPYATFYLGFTSTQRDVPALTDWLSRTLQPQLATLEGVQRVSFEGARPLAMRVWIDADRLASRNLSPGDVQSALQRNNYLAAVGQTKGNLVQVNLLADTDLRAVSEFENLIVADRDGAIVRLSDVARVELGAEEATMVAKYNAQQSVYLGVWPLPGSNEIEVAQHLREEMQRIEPNLPADVEMRLVWDGTMFMRSALKEITKTLGETVLIVALVVFLFLGSVRTALVPLVAMPVSLVGAAIVMLACGFSLNLLTILAIVLSVGLVVDDAIVVVENIERHVREGRSRIDAALLGARELAGPIVAMTVTLATVYTPIAFQGGLTGSLFLEFAITLAAAVVVSGIVALTLSPVMSSRFVHAHGKQAKLTIVVNRVFDVVSRAYARGLDRALGMRAVVVVLALLVTLAAWPLYQYSRQELAPVEDQSHISLFFEASPDSTLTATDRDSQKLIQAITAFPETDFMWSLTADWGGFGGLVAKDWLERGRSTEQMFGDVYNAVSQVPGLRVYTRLDPPLAFAVVLIYLVLAAQFQSFRDPLIVLLGSVPLAISGALVFTFLDLTTINIYSQVGLITLVGLIAKNGILIVEFANTLQERGIEKLAALREASLTRLRPVLMTSAATVFGHFPLVLVSGPGAEARNSIGIVLVTGMIVGTIFTLFVVPVFYSLIAADHRTPARLADAAVQPSAA